MSNLVIPNSFQTPNAYVDIAMQYLTGDEFKVLMFAVRHIFGFQDRIEGRQHQMSLSMFQNGTPNMGGTNLSKNTLRKVLKQLVTYKLLERIPIRDETNGGMYRIGTSPDWDAMKTRHEEQTTKKQQRAEKMNTPQDGITSDVIPYSGITCDVIPGLPSDVIQSNPTLKPKEIPDADASGAPVPPKPKRKAKPKAPPKPREKDLLFDAVALHLFNVPTPDKITKGGHIAAVKKVFTTHDVTDPQDVARFMEWYRRKNESGLLRSVDKVETYLLEYLATRRPAQQSQNGATHYRDELDKALKQAVHPLTGEALTAAQVSIAYDALTARYASHEERLAALPDILERV